ncbi:MAG: hypothetical protein LUI14_01020 [Lachnospiraceae bacterium]|nr:hypothetical protein [Lachnospiraceae bacterium]
MWDVKGHLIQLDIGTNAALMFSKSKRHPYQCEKLINAIGELRGKLSVEKIPLSIVDIRVVNSIPPDEYRLYMGFFCLSGSCKQDNVIAEMENWARKLYIKGNRYEVIEEKFMNATEMLLKNNYQKAMFEFTEIYYASVFSPDTYEFMVNSAINLCGIEYMNSNFNNAILYAECAYRMSCDSNFHNPYLKYHAAYWMGVVCICFSDRQYEAIQYFDTAYGRIEKAGEGAMMISALSAMLQVYLKLGEFMKGGETIETMIDIIQTDKDLDYEESLLYELRTIQSAAYKAANIQLADAYNELQKKYAEVSQRFLYKAGNMTLTLIKSYGSILLSGVIGELGSANIEIKHNGDVVIGRRVVKIER